MPRCGSTISVSPPPPPARPDPLTTFDRDGGESRGTLSPHTVAVGSSPSRANGKPHFPIDAFGSHARPNLSCDAVVTPCLPPPGRGTPLSRSPAGRISNGASKPLIAGKPLGGESCFVPTLLSEGKSPCVSWGINCPSAPNKKGFTALLPSVESVYVVPFVRDASGQPSAALIGVRQVKGVAFHLTPVSRIPDKKVKAIIEENDEEMRIAQCVNRCPRQHGFCDRNHGGIRLTSAQLNIHVDHAFGEGEAGGMTLIGGSYFAGRTVLDCAANEMKEETGMNVNLSQMPHRIVRFQKERDGGEVEGPDDADAVVANKITSFYVVYVDCSAAAIADRCGSAESNSSAVSPEAALSAFIREANENIANNRRDVCEVIAGVIASANYNAALAPLYNGHLFNKAFANRLGKFTMDDELRRVELFNLSDSDALVPSVHGEVSRRPYEAIRYLRERGLPPLKLRAGVPSASSNDDYETSHW